MSRTLRNIDPDELLDANRQYIDRVEREGLYAVYDATLDTLFLEIGGPGEALSEHLVDNVMVRVDPETLHIVGLEILDFFADFLPNNRLVAQAISQLELRKGEDSEVTLMEPKYKALRETMGALIPQLAESVAAGASDSSR
jgi:hypothetical protein